MGLRETGRMTNQATGDLIVRYFEDPSEEAWQEWGELFPDEEEGDAEPPVRTRSADSPGSEPTERVIPESRQKLEGIHRKIQEALKRDAAEAQDEWLGTKLPDSPPITPDLVIECAGRSVRVIFEVKSAADWADIYEGVGQLYLYRELFWADYDDFDCYTALVVCGDPDEAAVMALDRLGIYLFVASCEGDLYEISPSISDFLDID